jgi:hypothetical protein
MSSKKRVYIAGPMTGYPQWNFAAFDAAAADLRQRGYEVVNPVDLDRDVGFDPATSSPEDFDLVSAIRRDVEALVTCQVIALLPGHENSKGATAERHIAYWAGLDVVEYPSMTPIGTELPVDPWDVRNRSTPEQDEAYLARVTDEFVEDGKVFADEIRAAIKREFANSFTRWTEHQVQEPKQDPSQDSSSGHRPIPEGMRRELLECFGVEGTGTIPQAVKNVAYVPADFADDEGVKEWLGRNDVKPEDIRVVHNRESLGDKIVEFGKILKDHQTIVQLIPKHDENSDGQTVTNDRGGKQSFISARFDCIPPEVLRLLAQCLGFGARKYGRDNWRQIDLEDNIAHAMNHLNEWNRGDRSEPHLVNAMARITFALSQAVAAGWQEKDYIHPEMVAK